MNIFSPNTRLILFSSFILLLVGCSSNQSEPPSTATYQDIAATSPEGKYVRPLKDGAPWWDVDVSNIPDATPTPHTGTYKKAPYTVLGKTYYPINSAVGYQEVGTASWYGTKFHDQATANGEHYDLYGMTAAHKTLPLPSYVKVTNLNNGKSVILRVNDRGPFHADRIIDLSFAAAKKLGYSDIGTARVKVEGIDPVQWQNAHSPTKHTQQIASASATESEVTTPINNYQPPADQHVTISDTQSLTNGVYLQVGAFANPDAAELLRQKLAQITNKPVFINAVTQGNTQLYRVRLGPMPDQQEALKTQNAIRAAHLGESTLVKRD